MVPFLSSQLFSTDKITRREQKMAGQFRTT